ncbi:DIP1984 family protein [Paenibacillus gallinarum]|uniref:DIP1984 family protein n=1 Tax=Paenibacillus gallinarum TaxID=2762232 RepID=A0ABR8T333_9BACL|nr:DIP1984 family protein [Paenibacillus gallinarum]MBD7969994.1 DIP1984 family protein [Paenibacillus gallinarum]
MKLAEALILRSDLQKKIQELRFRLRNVIKIQEGEEAAENPSDLFREVNGVLEQFESLVQKINRTNSQTEYGEGMTITDALARREKLQLKRSVLSDVMDTASIRYDRSSRTEIKFITTVDISALQKQVDELAKEHRTLDTRIQELNWTTELIESS